MRPELRPSQFKVYAGGDLVRFAEDPPPVAAPALPALAGVRPEPHRDRIERADLERICHLANGALRWRDAPGRPGGRFAFRAAPCTGALYHIELYLAAGDLPGLDAGLYHHDAAAAAWRRLRTGDWRPFLGAATGGAADRADAVLVVTTTYWRNAWKYGARAYRHSYWDGGVVIAQAAAVANALGLRARVLSGFVDGAVNRLLDVDPEREAAIALVALGEREEEPRDAIPEPGRIAIDVEPVSAGEIRFPEIPAAHAGTSLGSAADLAAWLGRISVEEPSRPQPQAAAGLSLEESIRRRRSTRSFASVELGREVLDGLLAAATAPIDGDAFGAIASELRVVVHGVLGLAPGVYAARRDGLEPVRLGEAEDLRRLSLHASLGQDLGERAAVNLLFLADLDATIDRLGDRGYRAAALWAGIAAGRVEVAAHALGAGATGLTFLDDETAELAGCDPAATGVMYWAAVGAPWQPGLPTGLPETPSGLASWSLQSAGEASVQRDDDGLRIECGEGAIAYLVETVDAGFARGRKVTMTLRLRTERMAAGSLAGPLIYARAGAGRVLGGQAPGDGGPQLDGDSGWTSLEVSAEVSERAHSVMLGVVLRGRGTLRVRRLELS